MCAVYELEVVLDNGKDSGLEFKGFVREVAFFLGFL